MSKIKIGLYLRTLRYLRCQQIVYRVFYLLHFRRVPSGPMNSLAIRTPLDGWEKAACREPSIVSENELLILGKVANIIDIGWTGKGASKLWRYNQNYFDDLNSFRASQRLDWQLSLMQRWVSENRPAEGDGWEPYPTSLRIVNWIKWAYAGNKLPSECISSLYVQVAWLARRIEFHLLGNHLLSNAKALIFAGCFFSDKKSEKWLVRGLNILEIEVKEQILADGGHFERSTMYHALALEDMLDLVNVLRRFVRTDSTSSHKLNNLIFSTLCILENRIPTMLDWLAAMCHADLEIAFFNDSAWGVAPSCRELLDYSKRLGFGLTCKQRDSVRFLESSGYIRLQNDNVVVLFDAAPIGPDYLPGHAHADTLSLEFSVFGQRVLVNSGTSEYGVSAERHRQRSTAAHNTVEINGENSSEVWSSFRVARRAYPYDVQISEEGGSLRASAWHDGYKRLSPPVYVGRSLVLKPGALEVEDSIEGRFTSAISRFHCHPAVQVVQTSPNFVNLTLDSGHSVRVVAPEGAKLSTVQSTWHPKFGVVEPNTCILIQLASSKSITRFEWSES